VNLGSASCEQSQLWTLAVVSLVASALLTGLIWLVQLVQYPLLAKVGTEAFRIYHTLHSLRISWIVVPLMLLEVLLAVALVARGRGLAPGWWLVVTSALLALIWLSTFGLQVPCHRRLAEGFDLATWQRLVATNWIRTAAWSARTTLLGWWVLHSGAPQG
jgi:hypothetical protein